MNAPCSPPPGDPLEAAARASVRAALAAASLSQAELARRMHVTPKHISYLLNGRTRWTLPTLTAVGDALGDAWTVEVTVRPVEPEDTDRAEHRQHIAAGCDVADCYRCTVARRLAAAGERPLMTVHVPLDVQLFADVGAAVADVAGQYRLSAIVHPDRSGNALIAVRPNPAPSTLA